MISDNKWWNSILSRLNLELEKLSAKRKRTENEFREADLERSNLEKELAGKSGQKRQLEDNLKLRSYKVRVREYEDEVYIDHIHFYGKFTFLISLFGLIRNKSMKSDWNVWIIQLLKGKKTICCDFVRPRNVRRMK